MTDVMPYEPMTRREAAQAMTNIEKSANLRAALARVAAEDAETAAMDKMLHHAETLREVEVTQRHNLFASYVAGRPRDFEDSCFARLHPQQDPDKKVTGWWRSGAKNLLLFGPSSKGKSDAAHAICNEVAADVRDGRVDKVMVRTWSVVSLRALFKKPEPHEVRDEVASAARARAMREVMTCDLLLLDDVTALAPNDWFREQLFSIIDARSNDRDRHTIVTGNAQEEKAVGMALLNALGSPIVARLRKGTVAAWVDGEDLRKFAVWDPFADSE